MAGGCLFFWLEADQTNSRASHLRERGEMKMTEYKHPEVLVSTEWAAQNLNAPNTRFVEVDVDTTAYDQGHIPGAVGWNWQTQLQDNIRRDRSEEHTSELQSHSDLVCRLLLEKKNTALGSPPSTVSVPPALRPAVPP